MSKADEMFYHIEFEKRETKNYIKFYKKLGFFMPDIEIIFDKKRKWIHSSIYYLNMQELQAINEKCKELGWVE